MPSIEPVTIARAPGGPMTRSDVGDALAGVVSGARGVVIIHRVEQQSQQFGRVDRQQQLQHHGEAWLTAVRPLLNT